MASKRAEFSDEIRQAVDASGLSRYSICEATGIAESTMSRFMKGKGMSLRNIDSLARFLHLSVKRSGRVRSPQGK